MSSRWGAAVLNHDIVHLKLIFHSVNRNLNKNFTQKNTSKYAFIFLCHLQLCYFQCWVASVSSHFQNKALWPSMQHERAAPIILCPQVPGGLLFSQSQAWVPFIPSLCRVALRAKRSSYVNIGRTALLPTCFLQTIIANKTPLSSELPGPLALICCL